MTCRVYRRPRMAAPVWLDASAHPVAGKGTQSLRLAASASGAAHLVQRSGPAGQPGAGHRGPPGPGRAGPHGGLRRASWTRPSRPCPADTSIVLDARRLGCSHEAAVAATTSGPGSGGRSHRVIYLDARRARSAGVERPGGDGRTTRPTAQRRPMAALPRRDASPSSASTKTSSCSAASTRCGTVDEVAQRIERRCSEIRKAVEELLALVVAEALDRRVSLMPTSSISRRALTLPTPGSDSSTETTFILPTVSSRSAWSSSSFSVSDPILSFSLSSARRRRAAAAFSSAAWR